MQQVEFVKDFDIFLEKSEYGTNHTYQLHRELGGVFIEASFYDENLHLLFKSRFETAPPQLISNVLRWDENGFPYEIETYRIGDEKVVVPFYRPIGIGWRGFLLDITESIKDVVEQQDAFERQKKASSFGVPIAIVEQLHNMVLNIQEIVGLLSQKRLLLNNIEQQAIDRHFGECGLWDRLEDDLIPALATYLSGILTSQIEQYKKISEAEMDKRHKTLIEAENKIIDKAENTLKNYKFKKGFISS